MVDPKCSRIGEGEYPGEQLFGDEYPYAEFMHSEISGDT